MIFITFTFDQNKIETVSQNSHVLNTFHLNRQPRHFRRYNLQSVYNLTPIDVCFKVLVKTLQDCTSWMRWTNPNCTIKHANFHFVEYTLTKDIFVPKLAEVCSSRTCFIGGGTDSFQPNKQSSTLRRGIWVLKFSFTPVLVKWSERWWAMKTMRQKQVYSMISNIIALTFIISGCSGKLKLRMHYGKTKS